MLTVIPLRYGTAFKKAFADPVVFQALIAAALDLEFSTSRIEQEYSYPEAVARVNVAYDLFAEDEQRRTIVELQHVRDDESYDRFLYYHCIGLAEQIVSSARYEFARDVYTLVVLTRWPVEERLQFGRAITDLDPVTDEGKRLGVYRHRLVFVNARAPAEQLPEKLRPLMRLIDDTLDGQVDETQYPDDVSRRILARIGRHTLDPDENARLKEEATWENAQRERQEMGRAEGRAAGRAEGRAEGLRAAIQGLAPALGLSLDEPWQERLRAADAPTLERWLAHVSRERSWPTS